MYAGVGRKRKYFGGVERKSIREDSFKEENKKLKDKISAMRHHLCLLEFGLGSIATLLLGEGNVGNEIPRTCASSTVAAAEEVGAAGELLQAKGKDNVGDEESVGKSACGDDCDKASCGKYRKIVMGIGGVLADVETALRIANEDDKDTTLASTSSNSTSQNGSSQKEAENLRDLKTIGRPYKKDRIYIDEKQPGQNVLTGVCSIKIVENPGLIEMHSLDLESGQERRGLGPTRRSCTNNNNSSFVGLEALTTLASVASSVAIHESSQTNEASQNGRLIGHVGHSSQQKAKRMPKQ